MTILTKRKLCLTILSTAFIIPLLPPSFSTSFSPLSLFLHLLCLLCNQLNCMHLYTKSEKQDWGSGESAHPPPLWPCWLNSQIWCYRWVRFAVCFHPCSEGFPLGPSIFLSPQKTKHLKFQFNPETVDKRSHLVGMSYAKSHPIPCYPPMATVHAPIEMIGNIPDK